MDSASSHLTAPVLAAFRNAGLRYAIIPGGLTSFIQSIDVVLAAVHRDIHYALYMDMMEVAAGQLNAAQMRDAFVDLCGRAALEAENRIDIVKCFKDLGSLNQTAVNLRVPFEFSPPVAPPAQVAAGPQAKPKPKPKPQAKQMAISAFFSK